MTSLPYPFLQNIFHPDDLLGPGGAVMALFKQTPGKILSLRVFSRIRHLFKQTPLRISCVLRSSCAFVLFKHQLEQAASEYNDPIVRESMQSLYQPRFMQEQTSP